MSLLLLIGLVAPLELRGQSVVDPDHGLVAVGRLMRGLGSVKRVMVIGAHPDDEDTALLTWVERGLGGDAAYLSLTRGEGGQNLIGPELSVALGLLRTGELLAARRLDGADQYFTRAYDFGYSKSAEETFELWPRDTLLGDVVAAIRRFRPQVVVSVFSGTSRDGHGQHQAAGILARRAFDVAGDSSWFPEHLKMGWQPWRPLKLYRSTRFDRPATTLSIETGRLDRLYGRSYHQIAMASRSQHRSQDMGRIEALGPRQTSLALLASRAGTPSDSGSERSLFAGIDTTLLGLTLDLHDRLVAADLGRALESYIQRLSAARRALPGTSATGGPSGHLEAALSELRRALELADRAGPEAREIRFHLRAEERKLETALAESAGVIVEAFANDGLVVPGQKLEVDVQIWNGGDEPVELDRVVLITPGGDLQGGAARLASGSLTRRRFDFEIPLNASFSQPYFLRTPRRGAIYTWPPGSPDRGLPLGAPALKAEVDLRIGGEAVRREVEVIHRYADQASGEVRRPVHVVPAVSVDLSPETTIWPLGRDEPLDFNVRLRGEAPGGVNGAVTLEPPPGWTVSPAEAAFELGSPGTQAVLEFQIQPPDDVRAGGYGVRAVVHDAVGRTHDEAYRVIDYAHIRRNILLKPARASVQAFTLSLGPGLRVGYVPGVSGAVPEAMREMGLAVDVLTDRALVEADLSVYDAIVLGIRAYETNRAVLSSNDRLLDYVRAGGTLIVQYQQYSFFRGNYAPYPLAADFPHDRVSEEDAEVRILTPGHAVFRHPNRIGASDFTGWVQERGLYFAAEWDDRYRALLEMSDTGDGPKRGGLLVARFGRGLYVYTGLALFRQLPAGVPGAYRLLANLLSLKVEK